MPTNGNSKFTIRLYDWERDEITAAAASTGTTAADLVRDLLAYWLGTPGARMPTHTTLGRCRRPADTTCRWHPDTAEAEPVWKIEVEIPARVTGTVDLDGLFAGVGDAVHAWEPADREGWDAFVSAGPAGTETAEQALIAAGWTPPGTEERVSEADIMIAEGWTYPDA